MDTRTGLIHELKDGETLDDLAKRLNALKTDLVEVAGPPALQCPKCGGTGAIRRGLFSKRFKPCECIALKKRKFYSA